MNTIAANQKTRRELHTKVYETIENQNGEHVVNLCESNSLETKVILMNYPELYFLLKVQTT